MAVAREICACLQWIICPLEVAYVALPDVAWHLLHMLFDFGSHAAWDLRVPTWLMTKAPGSHGSHAPPGASATCPLVGAALLSSPAVQPQTAQPPATCQLPSQCYPQAQAFYPSQSQDQCYHQVQAVISLEYSGVFWGPGSGWGAGPMVPMVGSKRSWESTGPYKECLV